VRRERIADPVEVQRVVEASPSRLAQGRVGTRYTTKAYVQLRAEHAIALDAVHSRIADDFATKLGLIPLATRAKDHAEYLLHPDQGRRLDDASRERLQKQGTMGADVVIIVGDGLSAVAVEKQAPTLLPALSSALKYYGAELNKRRWELMMAAGGADALEWEGARSNEGAAARTWLRTKANSIEGGTSEVQLNVVAKRILGLPGI